MIFLVLIFLFASSAQSQTYYGIDDCVSYAYENNPEITEISLNSVKYESAKKQAEDASNPKFSFLTYAAPMYKITGDAYSYERDYGTWGPYIHGKIEFKMPIYTWGKIEAYTDAARHGIKVAKSEKKQKENEIAYEVKKYYYSLLLARTLKKTVEEVKKILEDAVTKASQLYESGSGEIKKSDLEKLKFYLGTAEKYLNEADKGVIMARLALMRSMGMKEDENFDIKDVKLARDPYELKDADYYVSLAFRKRPEWFMISDGIKAKSFLLEAEKADRYPVFFLAGEAVYDKAWTAKDQKNPWLNDNYNNLYGGAAVGAKFDFSPKTLKAKIAEKKAEVDQLKAKERFAREGITLQVKNSYYTAKEAAANVISMKKALDAAEKWVMSAGLTYGLGTGDVKEALEGLAARAQAQKDYYQSIYDYNMAIADLAKNCGLDRLADEK
ncbi:MAG: TolC family protein [Elusimicrobiota bacterium]